MNTLDRTLKYILIVSVVIVGAAFFYLAGLGTGLFVAQLTSVASLPATPTSLPSTPIPTLTSTPVAPTLAAPTASPVPTATPTPTVSLRPLEDEEGAFDIFWEAWHILQREFYGELPAESELPYAAIQGVIAATGDQYTAFLDPVHAEISRTDMTGGFEGIGATVRIRPDGKLEIVQPLPDRPAIRAGLRAKDVILEADGVVLQGMNIYEAISLIRGPAGTIVRLLVEREGVDEPFEIEIERARIELPVIESRMLEDNIGYVRLNEFGETATDKMVETLRELDTPNLRGLILDLRGNPGGYLSTAIEIASQFVGDGPILIERFKDESESPYKAIPGGLALDVPLVVLVDGGSASASEIVAGAIQDTGRGVLIGTTTLGKGSVQMVHTLSDKSQLRVTIARWFTPDGRAIHGEGLTPDIEVEITEEDLAADRDPQLDRAISYLLEGK